MENLETKSEPGTDHVWIRPELYREEEDAICDAVYAVFVGLNSETALEILERVKKNVEANLIVAP